MVHTIIKLIAIITIFSTVTNAARILGIFPYPSVSHQVIFRTFTTELSKRGHEFVIFTPLPMNNPELKNFTEVDLHLLHELKQKFNFFDIFKRGHSYFLDAVMQHSYLASDLVLSHPEMQKLISPNNTQKFDLILVQCLFYDSLYGLSVRLNAPMVGISSLPVLTAQDFIFGNPLQVAHSPSSMLGYSNNMNLWQRIHNAYNTYWHVLHYAYVSLPMQEKLVKKHFGDNMPPIGELSKNLSLVLVNSHPFIYYPRSNSPAFIEVWGCRVQKFNASLPSDLKQILDNAKSGFIYFNMGSNIKSVDLPPEIQNVFLEAFAELPYTVIWKYEGDEPPNKPSNVIMRKWLPQHGILAHPNIKLFIYQGGLQSTEETIHYAVPTIGIPVMSDQNLNTVRLEVLEVGKTLSFLTLNKEELKNTVSEIIKNPRYKENILKLRDLLHDIPFDPLERGVWWIEHVIRHKGARHLYAKSRDLKWYQNESLDVLAVVLGSLLVILYISFVIIRFAYKLLRLTLKGKEPKKLTQSKKQQ